jgi:hypothetical protein
MRKMGIGAVCVAIAVLIGCEDPLPAPVVDFQIDAPLCSSSIPVSLRIDGAQVGVDTFRVNLAPAHLRSRPFETTVGNHTLAVFHPNGILIQEDSTVALAAGQSYRFIFGFYCS